MRRTIFVACWLVILAVPAFAQNPTGETATPTAPRFATLAPVRFHYNSFEITDSTRAALLAAAAILKANPTAEIIVVGHTDERGSSDYNERLGRKRAEAVASFLREHAPAARIEIDTAGEREPTARGHDEAAWARNRRVEFRVRNNVPLRLPPR